MSILKKVDLSKVKRGCFIKFANEDETKKVLDACLNIIIKQLKKMDFKIIDSDHYKDYSKC